MFVARDWLETSLALSETRERDCPECMGSFVGWHSIYQYNRTGRSAFTAR